MILLVLLVTSGVLVPPEVSAETAGYRYGRVIIEGNIYTLDRVIHHFAQFRPGAKIIAADVKAARRRLCATGLFEAVSVQIIPNEFESPLLDVRVQIVERPANRYGYIFALPVESWMIYASLPDILAVIAVSGTLELCDGVKEWVGELAELIPTKWK